MKKGLLLNNKIMKIIYLYRYNPNDIYDWSGTSYYMFYKLKEKHSIEVIGTGVLNQIKFFSDGNFKNDIKTPIDRYIKKLNLSLSERGEAV